MNTLLRLVVVSLVVVVSGCRVTTHEAVASTLGAPSSLAAINASLASGAGPIELETVTSADWAVDRSGLLNLEHPVVRDAGIVDGDEAIQVSFHVIRHPTKGTFIVDTGIERALRDAPEKSALSGLVRSAMHMEKLKVHQPLGEWLDAHGPIAGVFMTHLHLDHVSGMPDVPNNVPVYTGPGEAMATLAMNMFVQGSTDRALAGKSLSAWVMGEASAELDGAVDVFGDGSVFALWVPGHTPGSTAYLVRSTKGPVLLTGDASHTRWGWEHDVEPGTFTADAQRGKQSFEKLRAFVKAHPQVEVRVGHQH